MNKNKIIELFDYERYREVYDATNPYENENVSDYEVLYFLKSKLVLDDFKIHDEKEIKKLLFYYFYLVGEVTFDNGYSFTFLKSKLPLEFSSLHDDVEGLENFSQYFDFGKNSIFLNKVIDTTIEYDPTEIKQGARRANNLIDFCLYFTYECSELYAFSGEHFPLFKWLINELIDDKH